jgi:hypothetical protein
VTTPQQIEIPPPSLDDVLYRKDEGFAWVTLNRPVVHSPPLVLGAGASGGRR